MDTMANIDSEPQENGKLIALEGDAENISIQLRLLPPSRKILVLPPLTATSTLNTSHDFNARTFVRDVHKAFTERTETARSFLQSSTSSHPNLVFLNGGAISARATCIAKISENLTNGVIGEAETIFNEIVKDGVAGLMKHNENDGKDEEPIRLELEVRNADTMPDVSESGIVDSSINHSGVIPDEVVNLPPQQLDDQSSKHRASLLGQRSGSDPGIRRSWLSDSLKLTPNVQEAIFTTREGDQIVRTVLEVPTRSRRRPRIQDPLEQEKRSTFGPCDNSYAGPSNFTNVLTHQSEESEDEGEYDDPALLSPGEDILSAPATPGVVFGEACLVDVQSALPAKVVRKARSFDRFYPSNSRHQGSTLAPPKHKHTTSAYQIRGGLHSSEPERENRQSAFAATLPRTTFVKASETTIKRSPTLRGSTRTNSSSTSRELSAPALSVDRITEPVSPEVLELKNLSPVFPVTEDLIIHFIEDSPNSILESVIQSYKCGKCPLSTSSLVVPTTIPDSPTSEYSSIRQQSFDGKESNRPDSYQAILQADNSYGDQTEFDPYAAHIRYSAGYSHQKSRTNQYRNPEESRIEPPTPIQTPPITARSITDKFVDLNASSSTNAVSIQNSLRLLLSVLFPPGESRFSQHYFPVAPEADRFWKPVFSNDDISSFSNEGSTVDQIIALGPEPGVNAEFYSQLSGQIERLGIKKDGINRSGKLDIRYKSSKLGLITNADQHCRYLIANAMQTYSMGLLTNDTIFNPLSNPKTLAVLLVPQIEAFLAINSSTRLLILQYQSSHLPVIFALRQLLGTDLLKVAGILDSLSLDPPSFIRHREPILNPLSNESVAERWKEYAKHARLHSLQQSKIAHDLDVQNKDAQDPKQEPVVSFSKANYILPSTATDAETTTFLSSICKDLMRKSTFYTPELNVKPAVIIDRPPMPPTPTSAAPSTYESRDSNYTLSAYRGASSKISRLTGNGSNDTHSITSQASRHRSPSRRVYHESVSIPTHKSLLPVKHERRNTLGDKSDKDWENFYIGEDDSDDDEFDRMIMGRQMARIVPEVRKLSPDGVQVPRNKKKALKWLGLA
jgi:hypothetical protein